MPSKASSSQNTEAKLKVFKALTENGFDVILIMEAIEDSTIIYVNKAFKKIHWLSSARRYGNSAGCLQGAATEKVDVVRLSKCLKKAAVEGRIFNFKDGTLFVMH